MTFRYYWDRDLFEALLRYRMRPYLADVIAAYEGNMGSPADIQKLVQRMQRANTLTDRAANSGAKGEAVMNAFEQTLNKYDDHFGKIAEYDKQISAMMDVMGNGGPALDAAFQSHSTTTPSSSADKPIDHATGDPLKT